MTVGDEVPAPWTLKRNSVRLSFLDSIRGVAAVIVVTSHLHSAARSETWFLDTVGLRFFDQFVFAVTIVFVFLVLGMSILSAVFLNRIIEEPFNKIGNNSPFNGVALTGIRLDPNLIVGAAAIRGLDAVVNRLSSKLPAGPFWRLALGSDRVFSLMLSTATHFDNRPGRLYSFVGHKTSP